MLIYLGQGESVVEVYETRVFLVFKGSGGLDDPKQCLIKMTIFFLPHIILDAYC